MYLDGKLVIQSPDIHLGASTINHPDGYLQIGGWAGPGWNGPGGRAVEFINGLIDEVRISNIARYSSDFSPENSFESDENTIALYHFDEGVGTNVFDLSGNGNDGTIYGDAIYSTDVPVLGCTHPNATNYDETANVDDGSCTYPDNGDYSLSFDGVDDYVDKNNSNIQNIESLTIETYINISEYPHERNPEGMVFYASNYSGQRECELYFNKNNQNLEFTIANQTSYINYDYFNFDLNKWYLIKADFNSQMINLYVDGLLVASSETSVSVLDDFYNIDYTQLRNL
jgi:hypothetical protein